MKTRERILQFVAAFIEEHGYSPSFREIQAACELSSVSQVMYHLLRLQNDRLVMWQENMPRTVRVADTEQKYAALMRVAEMAVDTWPKEGTLAIWVAPMREALAKLKVKVKYE